MRNLNPNHLIEMYTLDFQFGEWTVKIPVSFPNFIFLVLPNPNLEIGVPKVFPFIFSWILCMQNFINT